MLPGITIQPQKAAEAANPSPGPGVPIKQEKLDEPDLLKPANIKVGACDFFQGSIHAAKKSGYLSEENRNL